MSHNKSFGPNNRTLQQAHHKTCSWQSKILCCWIDSTVDTLTKVLIQAAIRPKLSSKSTKTTKRNVTEMHLVGMTNAKKSKDKVKPFQTKSTKLKKKQQNNCNYANEIKLLYWKEPDSNKTHKRNWSSKKRQLVHLLSQMGEKRCKNQLILNAEQVWERFKTIQNSTKNKQKQSITPQVTIKMEGKDATLDPREKEDLLAEQYRKVSVVTNSHLQLNREFWITLEVKQFCEQCVRKTSNSFSYCALQNNTEQTNRKIGHKLSFSNRRITFSTQHGWKLLCSWNQQRDAQTLQT